MQLLPRYIKNFLYSFSSTDRPSRIDPDGVFQPINPFSRAYNIRTQYNNYQEEIHKLNVVFSSPAMLKIVCLQCDLFSLGKLYVYKDGKEVEGHPLLDRLAQPNPFQTQSQLLWDYMFWLMIGNAYCYLDSNLVENDENKIYFLDSSKMQWPEDFLRKSDHLVLSKKSYKDIQNINITYKYEDGGSVELPLSKIIIVNDLTNSTGNRFKSQSRINALYKIISNSEHVLDATNINVRFTGKFLVSGTQDPNDVTTLPLTEDEKNDIETKMNGRKQVHAMKSMVEIKRFVENLSNLKLPEQYLAQYFLIGSMYNIPRDVLEAYTSSTYENQEKARGSHVSYTLQPKGDDFMFWLTKRFGLMGSGESLVIDWAHLPFMQIFEKDRAVTAQTKISTLTAMLKLGISIEECNEYLDTNFKSAKYEQPKQSGPGQAG